MPPFILRDSSSRRGWRRRGKSKFRFPPPITRAPMTATGAYAQAAEAPLLGAGTVRIENMEPSLSVAEKTFSQSFHSVYLRRLLLLTVCLPKKKTLRKLLTPSIHPNITNPGESRVPRISRNCENPQDTFARPIFGPCFRLALRGEHEFLRGCRPEYEWRRQRWQSLEGFVEYRLERNSNRA